MKFAIGKMKWIILFALVLSNFAYIPPSFADTSFRCGKNIVSLGDPQGEVLARCGEPMSKVEREYSFAEAWTYNFGKSSFMKRIIFSGGIITEIETLGRGK